MKSILIAILPLIAWESASAQLSTISTYSSGSGLGPTTTIQPTANGYNYYTIGGPNGGSWGGVVATPGSSVQAAIGPQGKVVPIVSPAPAAVSPATADPALIAAQIAAANAQELAADAQILAALQPLPSRPAPIRIAPPTSVTHADPINREFVSLFQKLGSKDRRNQFWRDFQADFPAGSLTNFPTRSALPYLKLWLRDHSSP